MDMPMKKKRTVASQAAARGPLPELPKALPDQLVKGPMTPAEVRDLMLAFNKAVIERAMSARRICLCATHGAASPASTSAFSARYARSMSVREIQTFLAES